MDDKEYVLGRLFPHGDIIVAKSGLEGENAIKIRKVVLYGAEGTGKTTFMRFLAEDLRSKYGLLGRSVYVKDNLPALLEWGWGLDNENLSPCNLFCIDDFTSVKVNKKYLPYMFRLRHILNYLSGWNTGLVVMVIGTHDIFCLSGDTYLSTKGGRVRLSDVQIGEEVLTAEGYYPVVDKCNKVINDYIYKVTLDSGHFLEGAGQHVIFSRRGEVMMKDLNIGDILYTMSTHNGIGDNTTEDTTETGKSIQRFTQISHQCTEQRYMYIPSWGYRWRWVTLHKCKVPSEKMWRSAADLSSIYSADTTMVPNLFEGVVGSWNNMPTRRTGNRIRYTASSRGHRAIFESEKKTMSNNDQVYKSTSFINTQFAVYGRGLGGQGEDTSTQRWGEGRIVSIQRQRGQTVVYDIFTNGSYVANGILVHNSVPKLMRIEPTFYMFTSIPLNGSDRNWVKNLVGGGLYEEFNTVLLDAEDKGIPCGKILWKDRAKSGIFSYTPPKTNYMLDIVKKLRERSEELGKMDSFTNLPKIKYVLNNPIIG